MSILRSVLSLILLMIMTSAIAQRLPTNVKPNHYMIKLMPKIVTDDFTFDGLTSINISILVAETKIILHAKNLTFDEKFTSLIDPDGKQIIPTNQTIDNQTDFLTIHFTKTPLAVGEYTLNLRYIGQLNEEPRGFYRKSYIDIWGKETWLAATQLAPIHARRVFPCFDEPSYKSEFEISIKHLKHHTAVSNMPISHTTMEENDHETYWTHFEVTPIMSTYQVAFVISELKNLTNDDDDFRIWSRNNQIDKATYALSVGETNLELLEVYMSFEHAIPKVDIFAIPELTGSATDSWGLGIYGESSIIFEENVTTTCDKQDIALTLTRGLAHQWFGGLASPEWWQLSWLDAGLGKYFGYFINDQAETKWRMMDQFVIKILQERAFFIDDEEDQSPLSTQVSAPEEITNIFNGTSSNKAASIIRMISHAVGAKVFRTGLKAYVKNNAYGSAGSDAFINALINAKGAPTNVNLKTFLSTWINNFGYPLITVKKWSPPNLRLTQMRYLSKKNVNLPKQLWHIPVSFAIQDSSSFDNTGPNIWFTTELSDVVMAPPSVKWIIFNKHMTGLYRVDYETAMWTSIKTFLYGTSYSVIPALNRAQLLDDSFSFGQSGRHGDLLWFFDLSMYLHQEDDYVPWYVAFRAFSTVDKVLANNENYNLFKLYILKIIETLEKNVGYDELANDDHITKLNRINLIQWACKMGSVNCTDRAHEKLFRHVIESKKISTDLRKVVLCAGIRTANLTMWEKTFTLNYQSTDRTEREAILTALGCSFDPKILKIYLTRALNPKSKLSLGATITSMVKESEEGVDVAMNFVKKNFKSILKTVGDEKYILDYANDIASRISNEDQYEKMETFINSLLAKHKNLADELTKSALPTAMKNIEWLEKHGARISTFLKSQNLVETI